jgi:hypothetical protein
MMRLLTVPATDTSLNHGDGFILKSDKTVFRWVGNGANAAERAKAGQMFSDFEGNFKAVKKSDLREVRLHQSYGFTWWRSPDCRCLRTLVNSPSAAKLVQSDRFPLNGRATIPWTLTTEVSSASQRRVVMMKESTGQQRFQVKSAMRQANHTGIVVGRYAIRSSRQTQPDSHQSRYVITIRRFWRTWQYNSFEIPGDIEQYSISQMSKQILSVFS